MDLRATVEQRALQILAHAGSYPAADDPRARNVPWGGSANYHLTDHERRKLREKSRALERGSPAYSSILTATCRVVVGSDGPELVLPGVEQETLKQIQAQWWADSEARWFDVSAVNDWGTHVSQILRSVIRDGDCGIWRNGQGKSAIFEAERIAKVTVNETTGQVQAFAVAPYSERGTLLIDKKKLKPVKVDEMTLPAWRERVAQTRGAPALTAGLHWIERLSSLEESEIISAELSALPWSSLETQPSQQQVLTNLLQPMTDLGGTMANPPPSVTDGPLEQVPAGWQRTDAGYMIAAPAGMKVSPWQPTRPNLNVPEFAREILRRVCAPLLPYEVLFSDPGQLSFSAVRAVGLMAQHACRQIRSQILGQTLDAIAREWLAFRFPSLAQEAQRIEWRWPDLVLRDREKEAAAADRELAAGIASKQSILGPDWKLIEDQRRQEEQEADAAAVDRIKKLAQEVERSGVTGLHWAHIATLGGAATAPAGYAAATVPPQAEAPSGAVGADETPADEEDMNAAQVLDLMAKFHAAREPSAPVQVHMHTQQVIEAEQVTNLGAAIAASIRLPEQPAPVVNVAAPHVTVEAAEPMPAPQVIVNVPDQPAPVVNVAAPSVTVENVVNVPKHKVIARPKPDGSVEMTPVEG